MKYFFYATFIMVSMSCTQQKDSNLNEIAKENLKIKDATNFWTLISKRDTLIEGFTTHMSVNKGDTLDFMIDSKKGYSYNVTIYRLGYYGKKGALKKGVAKSIRVVKQDETLPDPNKDSLLDCKTNWQLTDQWAVPGNAVSGVYVAHLFCEKNKASNFILFIVRDDDSKADILFKTSDPTWQAYNRYKDFCFYPSKDRQAPKVSYNRPITQDATSDDYFFAEEYRLLRWLERNGYDVKYCSASDIAFPEKNNYLDERNYPKMKILISVGHDEYWSPEERNYFEGARSKGINLAFLSGNECYWRTRWEGPTTLVCYKEGFPNGTDETNGHYSCKKKCDTLPGSWTGLWRNFRNQSNTIQPECSLSGQLSWVQTAITHTINVPRKYRTHRFWRNTEIAKSNSDDESLLPGLLGYEWNYYQAAFDTFYPKNIDTLSMVSVEMKVQNKPTDVTHYIHYLTLYKDIKSNALVFGAGTTSWALGLDNLNSDYEVIWPIVRPTDINVQQATMNLFYDMGKVLPTSKQKNLVDH